MRHLVTRFVLGAAASLVAGAITVVFGPRVGGVFLAFPAILPATLTLLERNKGTVAAVGDARGALAGALGLAAFAATVIVVGLRATAAVALLAALGAWIVASLTLYGAGILVERALGLQQYPPEVPVALVRPLLALLRTRRLSLFVVDGGAGGALATVLAEFPDDGDVVRGAVVTSDIESACELTGAQMRAGDDALVDTAHEVAAAAQRRWGGDIAVALLSRQRAHPTRGERYALAVSTAGSVCTHSFTAHRGREGNWGEAVLLSVRYIGDVAERICAQRAEHS